ncbi:MAG TPA: biotin-dependent carboxyltransferase family protein [Polyangiaceae bacterium]
MIAVVSVTGLATVQDGGRAGRMHEGVPPGGPLVPELLARANAAVRNGPGEAAIEVLGAITVAVHGPGGAILVASDDGEPHALRSGAVLRVGADRARVRYLAVRGGLDVPCVLGGRGTLLAAALGGLEGRPLQRGDAIAVGRAPERGAEPPSPPDLAAPVRVVPGPDLDRFDGAALATLLASAYTVDARSDRMGVRLAGPAVARVGSDSGVSTPMVRGAVQIPPAGMPIVLGPDHPTVGGYPVLATVVRADLGTLCARPAGAPVRFSAWTPEGASPRTRRATPGH